MKVQMFCSLSLAETWHDNNDIIIGILFLTGTYCPGADGSDLYWSCCPPCGNGFHLIGIEHADNKIYNVEWEEGPCSDLPACPCKLMCK